MSEARVEMAAIRHNLAVAASHLPTGCELLFAVKANAYGHGAVAVSRMLEQTRTVTMLGVAEVSEVAELRAAGVGLPVLKLSACLPGQWEAAVAADTTLTVTDADTIAAASAAAAAAGATVPVHLKLDTGMGRIGAPPQQAVDLARMVDEAPGLVLDGLFTHLATSDAADDDGFTAGQLASFRQSVAAVVAARGAVRWVHAANSGGVLFHDQAGMTMARPGIMGYGYAPDRDHQPDDRLRPALTWTTNLSAVKLVQPGTSVSYGRTWTADRPTCVGTIPVGYADGLARRLSNRGEVVVGGQRRPIIGRICMDQSLVALSGPADVGTEVVLIGQQDEAAVTADDHAAWLDTISYEVLCAIGARVPRLPV
ncbi:alanine racemase [Aestuariimicrobium ganziense]|uniref:alanine racemase n=1 Tax=Aestuariimicrobium ganziense TaxID=2773677 RepID=UPI0019425038|nr:alanine racemase [Aestuariimicrobium ganziense]